MTGVAELLDVARAQLGTVEDPPGSNCTKFGAWYGMNGVAWCGIFVSWAAAHSGNSDLIPRFAYTPAGANWFQSRGAWSSSPTAGSIVFYDTANLGRISHTGIVESVLGDGRWYSIEGNTNSAGGRDGGSVRRQLRSTVGTSRGGFGRPFYSRRPPAAGRRYPGSLLRRGSSGEAVRAAQSALRSNLTAWGLASIEVDGQFGPATERAVQWFQRGRGLDDDGIIGPATWAALFP